MFIAHLPAGYLLASASQKWASAKSRRLVLWCIMAGSIIPDLDMFYFYLIDARQTHHHLYWPHLPSMWVMVLGCGGVMSLFSQNTIWVRGASWMFAGAMLHLVLDTLVGGIAWLHPFDDTLFHLVDVPARRSWWVWNFLLHWTFLLEIMICLTSAIVWARRNHPLRWARQWTGC